MLDSATDKDIEHLDDMLYMLVEQEKQEDYNSIASETAVHVYVARYPTVPR